MDPWTRKPPVWSLGGFQANHREAMTFANKRSKAEFIGERGAINHPTGVSYQASCGLSPVSLACLNTSFCLSAISISPSRKRSLHDGF